MFNWTKKGDVRGRCECLIFEQRGKIYYAKSLTECERQEWANRNKKNKGSRGSPVPGRVPTGIQGNPLRIETVQG